MESDLTVRYRISPEGFVPDDDNWFDEEAEAERVADAMNPWAPEGVVFTVISEVL